VPVKKPAKVLLIAVATVKPIFWITRSRIFLDISMSGISRKPPEGGGYG